MNHAEVVAEDERKKRPVNFEAKRKRLEWEEQDAQLRKVGVVRVIFLSNYNFSINVLYG